MLPGRAELQCSSRSLRGHRKTFTDTRSPSHTHPTSDTFGAVPALPVPAPETAAATVALPLTPPPGLQHAEVAVRTELSSETPRAIAVPVPAATAGATPASSGTTMLASSSPTAEARTSVPPATAPPSGSQTAEDDVRATLNPRTSTPNEIALPAAAAGATGAAASVPPRATPLSDLEDEDGIPIPKYLDPDWVKTGIPDTKFYKDYPPDQWGQEAAPNAREWKIYRDEMTAADADTLKSWNGTLDVLLIFAGLFSAVSTAFIVESYKSLQPDYAKYMANFLYEAARSNLSIGGVLTLAPAQSMGPPDSYVHPSTTQRWTNGLWFTSLVVSLTVALLCILVKQWVDQYHARTKHSAPSLQGWARRHQIYYRGLTKWGVPTLISLLPLFLHVSLFLFFGGLVLFLRPLDGAISFTLLAILIITLLFYALSLVIPAFFIDCPSYTPLLAQALSVRTYSLEMLFALSVSAERTTSRWARRTLVRRIYWAALRASVVLRALRDRSKQRFARETSAVDERQFTLDGRALNTLLVSTNDPDVIDAGVEAIGAFSAAATLEVVKHEGPRDVIGDRTSQDRLSTGDNPSAFAVLADARLLRTMCALQTQRQVWLYRNRRIFDFDRTLGLHGVMLQVLLYSMAELNLVGDFLDAESRLYRGLLRHVSVTHAMDSSPVPHRQVPPRLNSAICQLFLRCSHLYGVHSGWHGTRLFLLAFCAGDFAKAEPSERASAIQSLLAISARACGVGIQTWNAPVGDADEAACAAMNRLFALLATHEGLLWTHDVAHPFIHQLGLISLNLYQRFRPETVPWEQLSGFAAYIQSHSFATKISRVALDAYINVLKCAAMPSHEDTELSQRHWTCVATLLKLQREQPLDGALHDSIEYFLAHRSVITAFGRASDTVLLNFLQATTALETRVNSTANGLSSLLCYRMRIQRLADKHVQSLFAGSFLGRQFLAQIDRYSYDPAEEDQLQIMRVARHCARLSDRFSSGSQSETATSPRPLDAMLRICDELEHPRNRWEYLDDVGLALVAQIRRGLEPGGELRGECDPSCPCWPQPEPQPTSRLTRWRNRIRGRISAAPESAA